MKTLRCLALAFLCVLGLNSLRAQGIIVSEVNGTPRVNGVVWLEVSNGTLTNLGAGKVRVTTGSGEGGGAVSSITGGDGLTATASTGDVTINVVPGNFMDVQANAVDFDPTEFLGSRTWGDGSTDTIVWTFNRATGTDPTFTFGDGVITMPSILLTTNLALTEIASINDQTFLGNITGGAASPAALTAAQVRTAISVPLFDSPDPGSTNIFPKWDDAEGETDWLPAADLATALGFTATITELNYTDGVTSAIQTQLDSKATLAGTNAWTGVNTFTDIRNAIYTTESGGAVGAAVAIVATNGTYQTVLLDANTTATLSGFPAAATIVKVEFTQDASGTNTVALAGGTFYDALTGLAITSLNVATAADAVTLVTFFSDDSGTTFKVGQPGNNIKTYDITVVAPNDLADAVRDATFFWINNTGRTFTIQGWYGISLTDNTTLNLEEVDADGANNATIDAVEIATNGTGIFYGSDTTITAPTIENGHIVLIDFDDTDTPTQVHLTVYGYENPL